MERPQMRWRVYIQGIDSDLDWLTTQFRGPEWWVEKSSSEVYVSGPLLELFYDPNEVRAFVAHWLKGLSGAHRLFRVGSRLARGALQKFVKTASRSTTFPFQTISVCVRMQNSLSRTAKVEFGSPSIIPPG